jgi:hypothetical protein
MRISMHIREQLDLHSDTALEEEEGEETSQNKSTRSTAPLNIGNASLRARQKPVSFAALEALHADQPAFQNFRIKLGKWLTTNLPKYKVRIQGVVQFKATDEVCL